MNRKTPGAVELARRLKEHTCYCCEAMSRTCVVCEGVGFSDKAVEAIRLALAAAERRGEDRVREMLQEWAATQAGVALLKEADDAPCSAEEHANAARLIAWGERAVWHRLVAERMKK